VGVPWTVIVTAGRLTGQKGGGALMAFREIPMYEVREVLRLWLAGYGYRTMEPMVRPDRKTIRRIVETAVEEGLDRAGGDGQLVDVFVAGVMLRLAQHVRIVTVTAGRSRLVCMTSWLAGTRAG
jgi:hypothetical protein